MKTILKYNLSLALVFILLLPALSQVELNKKVKKKYQVKNDHVLSIKNKFGQVRIKNWEESTFKIDVEVIAKGRSEASAQKILERIDIDISDNGNYISFSTDINNLNTRNNESFEINYDIMMPAENELLLENSFGDSYVEDRIGESRIKISYGALQAGYFEGSCDLEVSFGDANIDGIDRGDLEIKYSDVSIVEAGNLEISHQFSDLEIESMVNCELESKYGDVEIGKIETIDADVQFSGFSIGTLYKSLIMKASYVSDFEIDAVKPTFELIDINGKFGAYELNFDGDFNGTLEAEFEFADMNAYNLDIDYSFKEKDGQKRRYKGTIGEGGNSKIIVDSSYGDLRIRKR
jgi:hypothetical protein